MYGLRCFFLFILPFTLLPLFSIATPNTSSFLSGKKGRSLTAGSPLSPDLFAPGYASPPSASFAKPRLFTLRIGYARLPNDADMIKEIQEVDVPPEVFRAHLIWLDVSSNLYEKGYHEEARYVDKSPEGEALPRPHYEGKWAYLLPIKGEGNHVFCSVYFHHTQVIGWDYFLNLPHGARLDQTTFHENIELPINKWLIIPEDAIHHNSSINRDGSYLYHLLYLSEEQ